MTFLTSAKWIAPPYFAEFSTKEQLTIIWLSVSWIWIAPPLKSKAVLLTNEQFAIKSIWSWFSAWVEDKWIAPPQLFAELFSKEESTIVTLALYLWYQPYPI